MKKLVLSFFMLISVSTFATTFYSIGTAAYYNGYWGNWKKLYSMRARSYYDNLVFYRENDHPSEYCWSIRFSDDYIAPTKKVIKEHYKNKTWYEYSGWITYYISDDYSSIESIIKQCGYPCIAPSDHRLEKGDTPCVKKIVPAKIKIAPYKYGENPKCYNVWFENVGLAIDLIYSEW